MTRKDHDKLEGLLRSHKPPVPPAPAQEWERIMARLSADGRARRRRIWLSSAVASLAIAASALFILKLRSEDGEELRRQDEAEWAEILTEEGNDPVAASTYNDWLWLAEHAPVEPDQTQR